MTSEVRSSLRFVILGSCLPSASRRCPSTKAGTVEYIDPSEALSSVLLPPSPPTLRRLFLSGLEKT